MIPKWLLKLFGFGWLIEPGYSLLACFVAALLASFLGVLLFDSFIPKNKVFKNNWFLVTVLCIPLMTITFLLMSSCVSGKGGGTKPPENDNEPEQVVDKPADDNVPADNGEGNGPEPPTDKEELNGGDGETVVPPTLESSGNKNNPVIQQDRLDFIVRKKDRDFVLTKKDAGNEINVKSSFFTISIVYAIKDISDKAPNAEIHITLDGLTEQNIKNFTELIKKQIPSIRDENITEKDNQ